MSSYSYIYYNLNSHLIINNLNLDMSYYIGHYIHIHIYHNTIIYISLNGFATDLIISK